MKLHTIFSFATLLLLVVISPYKVTGETEIDENAEEPPREESPSQSDTINLGEWNLIITDERMFFDRARPDKADEPPRKPREERRDPLELIDDVETKWFGIDLGVSSFTHDQDFDMPDGLRDYDVDVFSSRNFRIHIYQQRVNLINQKLNLVHGLALDYKRFSFSNPVTMQSGLDSTEMATEEDVDFETNLMRKNDVVLPVYLYYRSNPLNKSRSFNLMVGGQVGVNFRTETRQETSDDLRIRNRGDFNIKRFNYGVGMRIGIGRFNFYANYELSPIFQSDRGPDLNGFTTGIMLLGIR